MIEYYLVNDAGDKLQLDRLTEHPKNKYSIDYNIVRYKDDADFELNQQGIRFTPFELDIKLKTTDYDKILTFFDFVEQLNAMFLEKVTTDGEVYQRRIVFANEELDPVQCFELYNGTITFTALSEWFQEEVFETVPTDAGGSTFPMTFPIVFGVANVGEIPITNETNRLIPLEIQIFGYAENPNYTVFNSLGEIAYQGKLNLTIQSGEKAVINTRRGKVELYDTSDNLISNEYQNQDFTLDTFIYLPVKQTSTFQIEHDGSGAIECTVQYLRTESVR